MLVKIFSKFLDDKHGDDRLCDDNNMIITNLKIIAEMTGYVSPFLQIH